MAKRDRGACIVTQCAAGTTVNKRSKGKTLARRTNVWNTEALSFELSREHNEKQEKFSLQQFSANCESLLLRKGIR